MRILGIDPGSVVTGFGVVEKTGNKFSLVEYGVIEAKREYTSLEHRLKIIYERLNQVIIRTSPDEAALELLFFFKNPQSLLKLSHARGVAMLSASVANIPLSEYSALEIKKSVTGKGRASKEQVQYMVKSMLSIKENPAFYDATDALAIAICHGLKSNAPESSSRSWKEFIVQNPNRIKKTTI